MRNLEVKDCCLTMKTKAFLFWVFVLLLASCGDGLTEKVVGEFDNGQPQLVRYLNKDGQCVREVYYHENGIKAMEGEIKDNLRDGAWTGYFPDGKVQSTGFYEKGVRTGEAKIYHENGNLFMEGAYKDNKQCGEWVYYDEQGYETQRIDYGG